MKQDEVDDGSNDRNVQLIDLVSAVRSLTRVARRVEQQMRTRTWTVVVAIFVFVAIGGLSISYLASGQNRLHRIVDGDCRFFEKVGTLDVPSTGAPALHDIVDTARDAYRLRCLKFGEIPPVPTYIVTPSPHR